MCSGCDQDSWVVGMDVVLVELVAARRSGAAPPKNHLLSRPRRLPSANDGTQEVPGSRSNCQTRRVEKGRAFQLVALRCRRQADGALLSFLAVPGRGLFFGGNAH